MRKLEDPREGFARITDLPSGQTRAKHNMSLLGSNPKHDHLGEGCADTWTSFGDA